MGAADEGDTMGSCTAVGLGPGAESRNVSFIKSEKVQGMQRLRNRDNDCGSRVSFIC